VSICSISIELNKSTHPVGEVVGNADEGVEEGTADGDKVDGTYVSDSPRDRVLNALIQLDTSIVPFVGDIVGLVFVEETDASSNSDCVVVLLSSSGALSFGRSNCTTDVEVTLLPPLLEDSSVACCVTPDSKSATALLFRLLMVVPTKYPTDAIRTAHAMTATATMANVFFRPRRRRCSGIVGGIGEDSESASEHGTPSITTTAWLSREFMLMLLSSLVLAVVEVSTNAGDRPCSMRSSASDLNLD
jgi:hypothetical protein